MSNYEYFVRIENKNVSKFVNFFITEEFHEQNSIEKLLWAIILFKIRSSNVYSSAAIIDRSSYIWIVSINPSFE